MIEKAFNKFFWGFFFVLLNFKILGFDIFPDIIGYILFALGFSALAAHSEHFQKAKIFNYIMIFLSIFSIYDKPEQSGSIQMGIPVWLSILIGILAFVMNLIIVYNLFAGIIEMANKQRLTDISEEADKRWTQYVIIQVAVMAVFVFIAIPNFAMIYMVCLAIASIAYAIIVMNFMKKCGSSLKSIEE